MRPGKGKILSSGLDLRFEVSRAQCVPVDLTASANSTFRDELEGDGSGWTDQGSGNDLRAFRETRLSLGAVFFDVIQPLKKENSCLVLAGKERGFGAEKITVRNLPQKPMRTLLLLHASAWPPKPGRAVGELEVVSRSANGREFPFVRESTAATGGRRSPRTTPGFSGPRKTHRHPSGFTSRHFRWSSTILIRSRSGSDPRRAHG